MTDAQIRYFITAARCLNFTEAAKQLFISQPALSQQITALERELNMQLFVREKKRIYLTPAALVLLEELPKYEQYYSDIIEKAMIAHQGYSTTLRIGVMEGQIIPEEFLNHFFNFRKHYPNVAIQISSSSLGELTTDLMEDKIDIAYTFNFEVLGKESLLSVDICDNEGVFFASKYHPVANQKVTSLKDLRHETFIMLRKEESDVLYEMIMNDCERQGFRPHIQFVSTLDENVLYTEMGLGIGIANKQSYACHNPNIVILEDIPIATKKFVFAWKRKNTNTAIPLFINSFTANNK